MSYIPTKAYLDGELSQEEIRIVEQELQANPARLTELNEMRAISSALTGVKSPEPVGYEATLFALSKQRKTPWIWRNPAWVYALGAACIAGLAFFSIPVTPAYHEGIEMASYRGGASVEGSMDSAPMARSQQLAATAESEITKGVPSDNPLSKESLDYPDERRAAVRANSSDASVGELYIDRSGSLSLSVNNLQQAITSIKEITKRFKGFVADSSVQSDRDFATGNLTIKVPVAKFESILGELKSVGEVKDESTSSSDLTTQAVDTDARIRTLKKEEDQLLEVMKSAKSVKEILLVRQQLSTVRQDLEVMEATMKSIRSRSSMSTISVQLTQRPTGGRQTLEGNWAVDARDSALTSIKVRFKKIGMALITAGIYSPIWIPVVIASWLVWRRVRKGYLMRS